MPIILRAFAPVYWVSLCGLVVFCILIDSMPQGLRFSQSFGDAIVASLVLSALGAWLAVRNGMKAAALALAAANIVLLKPFVELAHLAPVYLGRHLPFVDARLERCDEAMLFDWKGYFLWHAAHPWLGAVCRAAYMVWPSVALLVVGVLALDGRLERLARYLIAVVLSLVAVDLVAIATPSHGAYAQHGMSPALHPGYFVQFANFKPAYDALRAGIVDIYAAEIPSGAISFPSFHTTTVVLFIWALWPTRARWPVLLVELLCFAAIPVQGAHFLIDMMAGGAIGVVAIVLSARLVAPGREGVACPAPAWIGVTEAAAG